MITLETTRLSLREIQSSDAQILYELNKDSEVIKYTGDVSFASLENAKDFILLLMLTISLMVSGVGR